jgi:hypothetical protein
MGAKPKSRKSHRVALLLSGVMPGLGQFYNEDWLKGAGFFIGGIFLSNLALAELSLEAIIKGRVQFSASLLIRLALLTAFWVWAIYDADRSSRRKNALLPTS